MVLYTFLDIDRPTAMRCGHSIPQLIPTYDRRAQGPVGAPFFKTQTQPERCLFQVERLSGDYLPPIRWASSWSSWSPQDSSRLSTPHGQSPSLEWNRTIPGIKGSHTHDWFTTQLTMLYDGFEPSGPGGAFLGYTEHSFC